MSEDAETILQEIGELAVEIGSAQVLLFVIEKKLDDLKEKVELELYGKEEA